jgi:hypothetical protein
MNGIHPLILPTAFAAALFLGSQAALGTESEDTTDPVGEQQSQAQPPTEVDPERLDTFVDAFVELQTIHEQVAGRLQQVETEAEALALRQEAQDRMIAAVESRGMSVDEYNQVAVLVQRDPELLEQVREMAAERM